MKIPRFFLRSEHEHPKPDSHKLAESEGMVDPGRFRSDSSGQGRRMNNSTRNFL